MSLGWLRPLASLGVGKFAQEQSDSESSQSESEYSSALLLHPPNTVILLVRLGLKPILSTNLAIIRRRKGLFISVDFGSRMDGV